jgi:type VI secretion system secreted protein Hcp
MGIFLQLEGIDGDATDKNHLKWIACDSFTGGTQRAFFQETGKGTERETSSAELQEIGLRMKMHSGSPKVMLASLVGEAKKAVIHITRVSDTDGSKNYLEVTLTDVFITRYTVDSDGDTPWESVALNYSKIEKNYNPNGSDGKPTGGKKCGFDLKTGKKL